MIGLACVCIAKLRNEYARTCYGLGTYVIDEDGPVRRYGFAYGTLPDHADRGEERFTVEWDRRSDLISYDILSFSRSGSLIRQAAYPAARRLQRRFLRNSLVAMS